MSETGMTMENEGSDIQKKQSSEVGDLEKADAFPVHLPQGADPATFAFSLDSFPDKTLFAECQSYPALSIPVRKTAELRKRLKHVLFHRPKVKCVYPDPDQESRRILVLKKDEQGDVFMDEIVRSLLASGGDTDEACLKTTYDIQLRYEDLTADEVLRKILPVSEIPSAFEAVGHVAHLNLRDEVLPYKYWVGMVLLEKNQPRIRTVVNKVGTIETVYRTFNMEVIGGSQDPGWSVVVVKEEGCSFQLDFQKVYWNSRLAGEHRRLVQEILSDAKVPSPRETTVVADLMAGVGPFAIPLTASSSGGHATRQGNSRRHLHVYANDLNPSSYNFLQINADTNKCQNLHCFNQDARAFVHYLQEKRIRVHHVIMNLPASAPEFLDAFRGWRFDTMPRMHVHCFASKSSESNGYQDAIERCSNALGCSLDPSEHLISIHSVRDVSPQKNMLCVSFQLPEAVRALSCILLPDPKQEDKADDSNDPVAKRLKTDP